MDDYTWHLKSGNLIIDSKGKSLTIINASFEGEFKMWFFEAEITKPLPKIKKKIYCEDIDNFASFYPETLI